ncbi:sigma-54-dependent transcriptional regulator [Mucilaginibacter angelicae]|uniref:Sigma-54-dependent transcriptional regulator n=1 Tax=Mucilaginibacter angelicae TaxID=869718 RepID=A0ABV6L491_9SPHI
MKPKILIVEDQFIEAHSLERTLLKSGYIVPPVARSVQEGLRSIADQHIDLVLLDIILKGDQTGIDLARELNKRNIPFIYLSANSNRKTFEEAKVTEPYGFLVKPFREKDVLVMIDIALYRDKQKKSGILKEPSPKKALTKAEDEIPNSIIGNSWAMREMYEQIRIAARSNIAVLILGESGTGKELVAKEIHALSARNNSPFVVVNCSALPANLIEPELFGHEKGAFTGALTKRIGKFEQANDGTIFLDEIGELPADDQIKFLRVLQEKEIEPVGGKTKKINVRVIAATNRNLEQELANGKFRLDLYYRLNVFPIKTPPLRERKEDIPMLARHFISKYAEEAGNAITDVSEHVLSELLNYEWPGNIREFENFIFRSMLINDGPLITKIPPLLKASATTGRPDKTRIENERTHIQRVLLECGWRVSGKGGAADILGMNASTLNSRIRKLGISRPHKL